MSSAHGKHLFIRMDDGIVARSHPGMHGSWHPYPRRGAPGRACYQGWRSVLDATLGSS